MQKSGIISMESLYEVKAPLASFDTVDLGDDDRGNPTLDLMPVTPEESIAESVDSQSSNNSSSQNADSELKSEAFTPNEIPTAYTLITEEHVQSCTDGTDSAKGDHTGTGTTGSTETTSSENNATGGEILQRLKLKGKKHKETESKVKYQHIENTSDLSDQEKSPSSELKLASPHKICDSDTDSSDSDTGYIRTGYIAALKGAKRGSRNKNKKTVKVIQRYNLSGSDSTPNSSPKIFRPVLPPPLTEEERAQQSKRKAYEKRLQRLQVTTTPIERPRSTTPIDIFGLEEYANISSPEKTPQSGNLEKLKIRLPPDEFHQKNQSPRKNATHDPHVFSFNEDLLFTHTKSALVVQDDSVKGFSPKKILIPPTLSPALSPRSQRCSTALNLSPRSPRYFYTPPKTISAIISPNHAGENWAKFDDEKATKTFTAEHVSKGPVKQDHLSNDKSNIETIVTDKLDLYAKDKVLNEEEILTVNVKVINDRKVCDIKCEAISKSKENSVTNQNHTEKKEIFASEITDKMAINNDPIDNKNVWNDCRQNQNLNVNQAQSTHDIWETQENISDKKISDNSESNIGETLKEIIDNAFKDETFKIELEEKESFCDNISKENEVHKSADRIEKLDSNL